MPPGNFEPQKCAQLHLRDRSGLSWPSWGLHLVKRGRQGSELGIPVPSWGWEAAGAQGSWKSFPGIYSFLNVCLGATAILLGVGLSCVCLGCPLEKEVWRCCCYSCQTCWTRAAWTLHRDWHNTLILWEITKISVHRFPLGPHATVCHQFCLPRHMEIPNKYSKSSKPTRETCPEGKREPGENQVSIRATGQRKETKWKDSSEKHARLFWAQSPARCFKSYQLNLHLTVCMLSPHSAYALLGQRVSARGANSTTARLIFT